MTDRERLLKRLDDIGQSLARTEKGLALIGLGSVGAELDRLDEFSDLDFFAIVQLGYKQEFIHNLDWLNTVCPIVYSFQNTPDGHKILFEDGIFCEFAVFEPEELRRIPFSAGRFIWRDPAFDERLAVPPHRTLRRHPVEWQVGEALTNLYVGLSRYRRGEKLSAARFIQGFAVDRIVELSAMIEAEHRAHRDVFAPDRRYEQRFPGISAHLPEFIQGYERSIESARAILAFLDEHFDVNPAMKQAILELCDL
ncbi:MAG: hypothetical protein HZC41_18645 [Chloroflexi bacterium]|nr:hypothetical protein [Chloroflexota bacterium]